MQNLIQLISNLNLLFLHVPLLCFFLCELQRYQSACKAMENRALHHARVESSPPDQLFSTVGLCVFSLDEAVPTNLREKSISVKVDERRDHQLWKAETHVSERVMCPSSFNQEVKFIFILMSMADSEGKGVSQKMLRLWKMFSIAGWWCHRM